MLAAPIEQVRRLQIPREVDQDVARPQVSAKLLAVLAFRQSLLNVLHAAAEQLRDTLAIIPHVHDGDSCRRHHDVPEQERDRALSHASTTQNQQLPVKSNLVLHFVSIRILR